MNQKIKWLKITIVWLILLDALIIQKLISDYYILKSIKVANFITGNVVAHNVSAMTILNKAIMPLIIYNVIIALLLAMNYKKGNKKNSSESKT